MFLPQRPYLPLGTLRAAISLSRSARDLRRTTRSRRRSRALRPRRFRRCARPGRALGQDALARPAAARRLRARAPASADMGVHGRGDLGPRRGQSGLHAVALRRGAVGRLDPVHRAPAGPRSVPHPDAAHPQDRRRQGRPRPRRPQAPVEPALAQGPQAPARRSQRIDRKAPCHSIDARRIANAGQTRHEARPEPPLKLTGAAITFLPGEGMRVVRDARSTSAIRHPRAARRKHLTRPTGR